MSCLLPFKREGYVLLKEEISLPDHVVEQLVTPRDGSCTAANLEREEDFLFVSCMSLGHVRLLTGKILSW